MIYAYFRSLLEPSRVKRTIKGLRSRVECASYCFGDDTCRVAAYRSNGNCELLRDYYADLNVTTNIENSDQFVVYKSYSLVSTETYKQGFQV